MIDNAFSKRRNVAYFMKIKYRLIEFCFSFPKMYYKFEIMFQDKKNNYCEIVQKLALSFSNSYKLGVTVTPTDPHQVDQVHPKIVTRMSKKGFSIAFLPYKLAA